MIAPRYDVVIAGGGPAGAAAALTLGRAGLRVLLADARNGSGFRVGEGLPPNARSLLQELGLREAVAQANHRPSYGTVAFWGSDDGRFNDFIFELQGPGLQLDRGRFDAALRQAAQEAGADLAEEARVHLNEPAETQRGRPDHTLRLCSRATTATVKAGWLIDASGRSSTLARRLGARRLRGDALLAFYQRFRGTRGSDAHGGTVVEAVPDGWWYSVLLPSGDRLATLLTDADLVPRRALLSDEAFWTRLQQTKQLRELCQSLGLAPLGPPRGLDAASGRLEPIAGVRWIAVGDAAVSFDPLSSKGIANAMYSGIRGARAVIQALEGDQLALQRYSAHLNEIFRVYSTQLETIYALERRWPQSCFWRRRHGPEGVWMRRSE